MSVKESEKTSKKGKKKRLKPSSLKFYTRKTTMTDHYYIVRTHTNTKTKPINKLAGNAIIQQNGAQCIGQCVIERKRKVILLLFYSFFLSILIFF